MSKRRKTLINMNSEDTTMTISEQLKKELQAYYNSEGIVPGDGFSCKNKDLCSGNFTRGMQCHIGSKYGEKMRILVASLDCGNGGKGTIEERTTKVRDKAISGNLNLHMRGTYQALSYFLDDKEPSELVYYMVMTNTCKCCHEGTSNQMSYKYFRNCRDHTLAEISIIRPQIILFQGKNSLAGCRDMLSPIKGIENPEVSKRLNVFNYGDLKCYAVLCIHPSARGRQYKKRAHFYKETLPKIANYIKQNDPLQIL